MIKKREPGMEDDTPTRGRSDVAASPRVKVCLVIPANEDQVEELRIELNPNQVEFIRNSLKQSDPN